MPLGCAGKKGKLSKKDGVLGVYWYLDKLYLAPEAAAADHGGQASDSDPASDSEITD